MIKQNINLNLIDFGTKSDQYGNKYKVDFTN